MTTIDTNAPSAAPARAGVASVAEWFTTTDHKRIGRLYLVTGGIVALAALVVAALLSLERIDADRTLLDSGSLTQLFSLYRFGFSYLVLLPLTVGLGVAVVPLQLGARSLALPRVAAAGFWAWFLGGVLAVYAIVMNGGPGGGEPRFVDLFSLAAALVMVGLMASSLSLAVSITTTRVPGMNMRRTPWFSWSVLVMSVTLLVTLPIAVGNLIITFAAHHYPAENPLGGNLAVEQWVGFAFSTPMMLLFAIPVLGVFADGLATVSGRRMRPRGPIFAMIGLAGTAMFAAAVQAPVNLDDNFTDFSACSPKSICVGDAVQQLLPYAVVHLLPLLGVAGAVAMIAGAVRGRPRIGSAVVLGLFGSLLLLLAAAGNALYHIGDLELLGTTFEEGMWLAAVGAGVLAALAGIAHWGCKWWGPSLPIKAVLPIGTLVAAGFGLAAASMMIAGFADQPSALFPLVEPGNDAVVSYSDVSGSALWNALATAGHVMAFIGVLAFLGLALRTFRKGEPAGDDPWDGQTLEWATTSPAPADNFADIHIISSAEPLLDLKPQRTA